MTSGGALIIHHCSLHLLLAKLVLVLGNITLFGQRKVAHVGIVLVVGGWHSAVFFELITKVLILAPVRLDFIANDSTALVLDEFQFFVESDNLVFVNVTPKDMTGGPAD